MTDHEYRTLTRAYSNSDLSELKALDLGYMGGTKATPAALSFGTAFHSIILEPHLFDAEVNLGYMPILNWMRESIENDAELVSLIQNSERETVRQWIDPLTGLPCKGKLDMVVTPKRKHLIDLKSTSCTSLDKFLLSCYEYDYDRQAAFYLSSDPDTAEFFEFVGVQKQKPYRLYRLAFHKNSDFITYGRKKMDFWLQRAKQEADRENGWRPSAWSRKEVLSDEE